MPRRASGTCGLEAVRSGVAAEEKSCGWTGFTGLSLTACSAVAAFRFLTSASSSAIRSSIDRMVAASTLSVSDDGWLCPSAPALNAGKRKRRITTASPETWTVDLAKRTPHPQYTTLFTS
jgi:hypothetical protein